MPIGFYNPAAIEVQFWYNSGTGWVLAQSLTYSAVSFDTYSGERFTLTVDGMGPYTDFGMDSELLEGIASMSPTRVEWYESAVPTEYDATPSGASAIPFVAIAGT